MNSALFNTLHGNGDRAIEIANTESVFRFDSLADFEALLDEGFG